MPAMTLQGSFTAGELSPSLTARVDLAKYGQGCKLLSNMLVQPHGGAVKRPGFLLLDALPGEAALIPFVFNPEQAYVLCFGEKWLRVATAEGFVLGTGGGVYQIASPYTLEQAKRLSWTQSADVLFLACQGVRPQQLKRSGHASWAFSAMSFSPSLLPPGGLAVNLVNEAKNSGGAAVTPQLQTPYTYFVTAVDKDGNESEAQTTGASITGPASNNWNAGDYLRLTWGAVSGAVEYRIYKGTFGGNPGFVSTAKDTEYRDFNQTPLLSDGPPKWLDPFADGKYPAVVNLFEQRLVFASTESKPHTIWLSRSGDYDNFSYSTPTKADDSIQLTIAGQQVAIMRWLVALRGLVMGTAGMEWEAVSTDGAFSATTAKVTPQSYRGSNQIPALVVGNTILHVARSGNEVRDFKYDFGSDSYAGSDRTIMAEHLFSGRQLKDWAYQASPDSIIWCVRDDGALLGLTFMPEHEVFAWHQHHTDGQFKAVCAIPVSHDDRLFAVVERAGVFYLELMADRYLGGDNSRACFADCALMAEFDTPVREISGLGHLEGKTVWILGDGSAVAPQVVSGGKIKLPSPARVVIVGLPYLADLESMPVEIVAQDGTSVGRKKYVNAVNVLFKDTVTCKVGPDFLRMEEYKARSVEPYGQGLDAYSGTKRFVMRAMAQNMATVCVRSDGPLPLTVLALMPEVEVK